MQIMLMIPAMIRRGFSKGYAAAAAATAGGVGIIIPPSIPMVVYAVSGQQSITKMFLAASSIFRLKSSNRQISLIVPGLYIL